jgi:hypothetical protein
LLSQRIYAGKFSNRTKRRIISESPLIEVYKNVRIQFEKMFCLQHKTTRHSPPKMKRTFAKLAAYMRRELSNTEVKGRDAVYSVSNAMASGMNKTMVGDDEDVTMMDVSSNTEESEWVDLDDGMEEVEDDGSLDVD